MATILFKTASGSEFRLEIGTEGQRRGADLHLYAGGSDSRNATSVYEADKGYTIMQAVPVVESQWGEAGYTTSLVGRGSNVEKTEKITEVVEGLIERAESKKNESTSEMLKWVRKYLFDYYMKATSVNARFEANAYANSREIKTLGVVIDTKTANIGLYFTFVVMKLITPEELELLGRFFDDAIVKGENVERIFE
jgi:hypothetical protein